MDESKSESNANYRKWIVFHYIFLVMYEKIVFNVMDNKNV
jgi:hypothetical protein